MSHMPVLVAQYSFPCLTGVEISPRTFYTVVILPQFQSVPIDGDESDTLPRSWPSSLRVAYLIKSTFILYRISCDSYLRHIYVCTYSQKTVGTTAAVCSAYSCASGTAYTIRRHWLPAAATFQQSPKLNHHWNYNVCFSIRFQGLKLDTHLLIFAYLYCTAHVLFYTLYFYTFKHVS